MRLTSQLRNNFPILALAAVLITIIAVSCNTNPPKQRKQHNCCNISPSPSEDKANQAHQDAQAPEGPPGWRGLVAWPEGVTALAVITSLFFIGWQALKTHHAADAAKLSAKAAENSATAMINGERAWVMAEVKFPLGAGPLSFSGGINDGSTITDFEVVVKNVGRTPAWIYEQVVQMTVSKLPPAPEFDETCQTNMGVYPVVQDEPATTWKPFVEAKGLPDLDGQPYIFGVVRYRDAFSDFRETYFGYVVRDHKRLERLPNPAYNKYK